MQTTPSPLESAKDLASLEDIGDFRRLLPRLEHEAQRRRDIAMKLLREASAYEKIIEGVQEALNGTGEIAIDLSSRDELFKAEPPGAPPIDSPRGTEAVRLIMRQGGVWGSDAVYREMQKRGWIDPNTKHPRKAVETAITRLHGKYHEIERVGRGRYRYRAGAPGEPNPFESDPSDERSENPFLENARRAGP